MKRFICVFLLLSVAFIVNAMKLVNIEPVIEQDSVGVRLLFDGNIEDYDISSNPAGTVYTLSIKAAEGDGMLLPIQVGPLEAVSVVVGEALYVNFFNLIPVKEPLVESSGGSLTIRFKRAKRFSREEYVFTGEEVSLREILKYIMGEDYLNLNYVISEKLETEKIKLTMRLAGMGADDVFRDLLLAKSGSISYAYLPDGTLYIGTPEEVSQRVDTFWQTYGGVKLSESGLEELRTRLPMDTLVEYVPGKGILFVYGDLESHMKIAQLLSSISPTAKVEYSYSKLSQYYALEEIGRKISDFLIRLKSGSEEEKPLLPDIEFSNVPEAGKVVIWVPEEERKFLISLLQAFEANLLAEKRREENGKEKMEVPSFKTFTVEGEALKADVKAMLDLLGVEYRDISNGFLIKVTSTQFEQLSSLKEELSARYSPPVTELRKLSRYIDEDMAKILADMVVPQRVERFELVLLEGRKLSNVVKVTGRSDSIDRAIEIVEKSLDVLGEDEVRKLYTVAKEELQNVKQALSTAFPSLSVETAGENVLVVSGQRQIVEEAEEFLQGMETPPEERVEDFFELPIWAAEMGVVEALTALFPSANLKYYDRLGLLLVEIEKSLEETFSKRYDELLSIAEDAHKREEEALKTQEKETVEASPSARVLKIVPSVPGVEVDNLKNILNSKGLSVELQLIDPFGYIVAGAESDVEAALGVIHELRERLSRRAYSSARLKENVDKTSLMTLFSSLGIKVNLLTVGDTTLIIGEESDIGRASVLIKDLGLEMVEEATPSPVEKEKPPEKVIFKSFNLDTSVNVESLKLLLSRLGYEVEFVQIGRQWIAVGAEESVNAADRIIQELKIQVEEVQQPSEEAEEATKTVEEKSFEMVKLESVDPVELISALKLFYPEVTAVHFEKLGILILMGKAEEVAKAVDMVAVLKSMAMEQKKMPSEETEPSEEATSAIPKEAVTSATTVVEATVEVLPFEFKILPDGSFAIDVKDQELGLVLETLAEKLGKSLMIIDYPFEKLNLKSERISWEEFLKLVEEFYPYTVLERNGVVIIQKKPTTGEATTTEAEKYVLRISHNIEEVAKLVEFYGGTVYTDDKNELMIVTGISEKMYESLQELVKSLSSPKPVVKISARIIDKSLLDDFNVSLSTLLDLGHAGLSLNAAGGSANAGINSSVIDLFDYRKLMEALTEKLQLNANVDLKYLLSEGDILSEPQITTVSGEEARIFVGQQIPYVQGYDENGKPIVDFSNPGIELDITPQVRSDGTISLKIFVKVSDVDYYNPTPDLTYPIEKTRQAETSVIVTQNQAVVIGGLVRTFETVQENRLPFLGSLPFLGELFKSESKRKEKSDLIIFITAEVVSTGS
ncbi:MAG: hypothetical protein PWP37_215 [Thermotogota bacterium]|nr:hypothetical protein [Thermotogota bacterium]